MDRNGEWDCAESILAQRLGRLVALGVLTRRTYQDNPPRDEYLHTGSMTRAGR